MSPLPKGPWEEISIDFAHVNGETLLIVTDDYSRYPIVVEVSSTAAHVVIPKLDKLFADFGIPYVVRSDNGPPFNSEEFARFANILGFNHRRITPYWSRANGEVERFIKTLRKAIRAAKQEKRNWKKELQQFLRNYRTTPHTTTGIPPGQAFLNRPVRNKLPDIQPSMHTHREMKEHDDKGKAIMKKYADNKAYVKPTNLQQGEKVLVRRPFNMAKDQTLYEEEPLTIIAKKGTMLTARNSEKTITRNSSYFKPITISQANDETDDVILNDQPDDSTDIPVNNVDIPITPPVTPVLRRSSRIKRTPKRYKDYI